ncbi:CAI-1 autoinducer synthase domain protein, partial [Vibrio parahaemolyticus VPTS-2010_2]
KIRAQFNPELCFKSS